MSQFAPQFAVSPTLLDRIKRIAILVHELNKRRPTAIVLAQLEQEAAASATFASHVAVAAAKRTTCARTERSD